MNDQGKTLNPGALQNILQNYIHKIDPKATKIVDISIDVKKEYYNAENNILDVVALYIITLRLSDDSQKTIRLFGKTGDPLIISHVARAIQYLRKHGFETKPFLVPEVIIVDKKRGFMLQREINAQTLRKSIEDHSPHLKTLIVRAAKWISALHALDIDPKIDFVPSSRKQISLRCLDEPLQQKNRIALKQEIIKLQKQLYHVENKINETNPPRFIHGDFQPENILTTLDSVIVIDFLESHLGDIAFDIGSFIAQISFQAHPILSPLEIEKLQNLFVQTYLSESKHQIHKHSFQQRIEVYTGIVHFRNTIHCIIQKKQTRENISDIERGLKNVKKSLERLTKQ